LAPCYSKGGHGSKGLEIALFMYPFPRIKVDWNNAIAPNSLINLYLNCSTEDFKDHGLTAQEGLKVRLCGDLLEADAIIVKHVQNGQESLVAKVIEGTLVELPTLKRDSN
jgi:hypothetical protein